MRSRVGQKPVKGTAKKPNRFVTLFILAIVAVPALRAGGGGNKDLRITAVRIKGSIVIDGEIDEPEWRLAEPAAHFIQRLPRYGDAATEKTEVRLLYNEEYLYVAVYCFDSAGAKGVVVNDITKDFYTLDSDGFQIVLDTFNDSRNSFLFGTNPKGGRFDMQIGADGNAGNTDWDGIWYVKTRITEQGWQAEMAIPFKTLRFHEDKEQVWGVNFERRVRRKFEDSYWAPLPPEYRLGRVSLAGTLHGIQGIKQGQNLNVKPYVSAPVTRRENDDVDFKPQVGLDVKYGVSSQLTLDATVNTDFSQVEADDAQINLTRFSLFFPEKRDFFLENAGIFAWGNKRRRPEVFRSKSPDLIPFFSRRIGISDKSELVPIRGGGRLTGRAGQYTLGFLSMQTGEFEATRSTNFSVVRLRRDILRQSDIGGLFINKYEEGGRFNRTYGADANFRFLNYLDINSFFLKTDSPGLNGRDQAGDLEVSWRDSLWDLKARRLWIGENFNPEVGFAPRRGMRKTSGEFGLTPRPHERVPWIREFQPSVEVDYITDPNGVLETRRMESRFGMLFGDSSVLSMARQSNFERLDQPFQIRKDQAIPAGDYRFDEYSLFYQSDRSQKLGVEVRLSTGSFYNGSRDSYGLGLTFQPNYRFTGRVFWTHNSVNLPSGNFVTNLLTSHWNYSFNTNMFVTALIQYNSNEREVSSNIRFNFIHRPLSNFFLVYNERRMTSGEVTERALVAKLTYVFSF